MEKVLEDGVRMAEVVCGPGWCEGGVWRSCEVCGEVCGGLCFVGD